MKIKHEIDIERANLNWLFYITDLVMFKSIAACILYGRAGKTASFYEDELPKQLIDWSLRDRRKTELSAYGATGDR